MGDVQILNFLEGGKQPFRLLRIVATTFQLGDDFALTSNVPFTCRDMATGLGKTFQESGAVRGT